MPVDPSTPSHFFYISFFLSALLLYIYGMENKVTTISGGMGLTDGCFDHLLALVHENWKTQETVSDALNLISEEVRREELDVNCPMSAYEKKLVLAGYLAGRTHGRQDTKEIVLAHALGPLLEELKKLGGSDEK